jgi:competence protein ComEA
VEPLWQRSRGWILFAATLVALAGIVLFHVMRPGPQPVLLLTPAPLPSPESTPTDALLRVYVSGAVQTPDVVVLPAGSIVKDALLAAGGATADADLDRINLALAVAEGQHIYVPRKGEVDLPVQPPAQRAASDLKVNINTADATALESLPGIGPSLAQRILDYRQAHGPFARIEDIQEVSGIGPATFDKIEDLIRTE